jgi:hypothetical protein
MALFQEKKNQDEKQSRLFSPATSALLISAG